MYDVKPACMISEHTSQIFMYDIRDDINYEIIHDGKVSIPTAENALHRALSKSRSAGSSAGCSKSATVI